MSTPDDDITRLIARTAQRDRTAFRELYGRVGPRFFGAIRQQLGDVAEADALLVGSFVEIWRRARGFSGADPERWLADLVQDVAGRSMDFAGATAVALPADALQRIEWQLFGQPGATTGDRRPRGLAGRIAAALSALGRRFFHSGRPPA